MFSEREPMCSWKCRPSLPERKQLFVNIINLKQTDFDTISHSGITPDAMRRLVAIITSGDQEIEPVRWTRFEFQFMQYSIGIKMMLD